MMTPNDIEILIHCYCISEVHPRIDYPSVRETFEKFKQDGIIEQRDCDYYVTTAKGEAWMKAILSVPYPTHVWIDSNGKIIT